MAYTDKDLQGWRVSCCNQGTHLLTLRFIYNSASLNIPSLSPYAAYTNTQINDRFDLCIFIVYWFIIEVILWKISLFEVKLYFYNFFQLPIVSKATWLLTMNYSVNAPINQDVATIMVLCLHRLSALFGHVDVFRQIVKWLNTCLITPLLSLKTMFISLGPELKKKSIRCKL